MRIDEDRGVYLGIGFLAWDPCDGLYQSIGYGP